MGKEGFDNEGNICNYLNGKKYFELNSNMGSFIKKITGGKIQDKDVIICKMKGGANKGDIIINALGKSYGVSIKSGFGNSVHQEPVEDFIKFLSSEYKIDSKLADCIRLFIWGDGTLDGKGELKKRLSATKIKTTYPEAIHIICKFFSDHKKDLVYRFVILGKVSKSKPDYIYYGDVEKGYWATSDIALEWLIDKKNESDGAVPVGRLTFQAWNRNINGGGKSEHKRGHIQLKWGSIGKDLEIIMKEEAGL